MRHLVYNASHIRDIGRTRGNNLLCASGVGRLGRPLPLGPADIEASGYRVSGQRPLLLASDVSGFIIERNNVSVVINPLIYSNLDEPPMQNSAWLYLPKEHLLLHAFGHDMPLSEAEVTSGRMIEKGGIVYRPLCTPRLLACVAASEPASLMNATHSSAYWFRIVGGVLGGLLAAVVLLLLRSHRSIQRQLRRAVSRGAAYGGVPAHRRAGERPHRLG